MATQCSTLHELGDMLRRKLLTAEEMKLFVNYVRCVSYPDPERHQTERGPLEKAWPAYAADQSLARLPASAGGTARPRAGAADPAAAGRG